MCSLLAREKFPPFTCGWWVEFLGPARARQTEVPNPLAWGSSPGRPGFRLSAVSGLPTSFETTSAFTYDISNVVHQFVFAFAFVFWRASVRHCRRD